MLVARALPTAAVAVRAREAMLCGALVFCRSCRNVNRESGFSCHLLELAEDARTACTNGPDNDACQNGDAAGFVDDSEAPCSCVCDAGWKGAHCESQVRPSEVGFLASLETTLDFTALYWMELRGYEIPDGTGYNAGEHFNTDTGRFTAPVSGYYLCAANVRLDNIGDNYSRLCIGKQGNTDTNQGLHVLFQPGTSYNSLHVAGTLLLEKDEYASAFGYSVGDHSW